MPLDFLAAPKSKHSSKHSRARRILLLLTLLFGCTLGAAIGFPETAFAGTPSDLPSLSTHPFKGERSQELPSQLASAQLASAQLAGVPLADQVQTQPSTAKSIPLPKALLTPPIVRKKMEEVFQDHFLYHTLNPELVERQLKGLLQQLDPQHAYFIQAEIEPWSSPQAENLKLWTRQWSEGNFQELQKIEKVFVGAIIRRRQIEESLASEALASKALASHPKEREEGVPKLDRQQLRTATWPADPLELEQRLKQLKELQRQTLEPLAKERQQRLAQRIDSQRNEAERPFLSSDPLQREHAILQHYLAAFAESLDAHTVYFTPQQALQFASAIHRKITGIGVVLRDEFDGYTILRIVEQSPAARSKALEIGDRIVAIEGEPTASLELSQGVLLIQGERGSQVQLTIQRSIPSPSGNEETLSTFELTLKREEVILQESRYQIEEELFGQDKIATVTLHSFYQGGAADLRREIEELKADGRLRALILDLRNNSGGLLTQSLEICGLFLHPGIIVSAKMPDGKMTHLRLREDNPVWEGPLIVLVNRFSASCSEIVSGALQDWGRAAIVGDDHTCGKGTFQLFTFREEAPDPYGVFTITQGIYYTASGRSPQLVGIEPDIVVPGAFAHLEIGESTLSYPLPQQRVEAHFEDQLEDVGYFEKQRLKRTYLPKVRKPDRSFGPYLAQLKANSTSRQGRWREQMKEQEESQETLYYTLLQAEQSREAIEIAKDWLYLLQTESERQAS